MRVDPHELMQQIIATAKQLGVQSIAAGFTRNRERMVRFSNNSITVTNSWLTETPTIYLVTSKKRAACRIEEQNPTDLNSVIEELVKAMKVTPEGDVSFTLPKGPFKYEPVQGIYDKKVAEAETELVDAVEIGINSAKKEGAVRVSGVVSSSAWERYVLTSAGAEGSDRGTEIEMTIRAFTADDAAGQGISVATGVQDYKPEEAGRAAGGIAKMAQNPEPGEPGKYNVVFGPSVFANLLNRVGASTSAYTVDQGLSFFQDMVKKKVASDIFTLYDNSHLPGGPGSPESRSSTLCPSCSRFDHPGRPRPGGPNGDPDQRIGASRGH